MTPPESPQPDPHARPSLLPFGQDAVIAKFSRVATPEASGAVQAFKSALDDAHLSGVVEIAPSLTSVLIRFDPAAIRRDQLEKDLQELAARGDWTRAAVPPATRRWDIPACFGGEFGPNLSETAQRLGVSPERAVQDLTSNELRVLAIGFAPGQPYLGLLPELWSLPRLPELTPHVPAGAIAVAVRQLVLFSADSATGWRHVGRCAFRPFQPDSDTPFPLRPGDAVRFSAVSEHDFRPILSREDDPMGGARCEVLS